MTQATPRQHALGWLVYARSRAVRALRLAIVALGIALGLAYLRLPLESLLPQHVYRKDFLQEYLLARALVDGTDPYLPTEVLAERYLDALPKAVFPHPTPHPPTVGILFLPLSLLDYYSAAAVWLGLEIICLIAAVYLLGPASGGRLSAWGTLAIAIAVLAWYPFYEDLVLGQLMLVLLVLVAGARLALLSGRPILGGALVGLAVLVKPVPWPLVLLFVLRRDWRALGMSVSTVLLGYAAAGWLMGLGTLVKYLTQVVPAVAEGHKAYASNLSLWSVGWRVFEGTGSPVFIGITAPPLVRSGPAALVVSAGVPALVLLIACLAVRKQPSLDTSLGVMICVSILISPISWGHYLVLAAIPAAQVIRWLACHRFPSRETNAALLVAALLAIPDGVWAKVAFLLAGQAPVAGTESTLPFAPALLTLGPALAVGALGWLVATLGAAEMDEQATPRAR